VQLLKTFEQLKHSAGRSKDLIEGQTRIRSCVEALALQLQALRGVLDAQASSSGKKHQVATATL
jgi:hypothetical protein